MVPLIETLYAMNDFEGPIPTTSPPPSLRVVSTLYSDLRYVVTYTNLRHLTLLFDTDLLLGSDIQASFSKLPHLESLSITIVQSLSLVVPNPGTLTYPQSLIQPRRLSLLPPQLPSTFSHLSNFPSRFPWSAVYFFFSPNVNIPPRLRVFRLHVMGFTLDYFKNDIKTLKKLCQARGTRSHVRSQF